MMTQKERIEERVAAYSDAFDFYLDCGEMPDSIPQGDLLGGYLKSVIDNNPQLDGQDPIWKEVLKDDLLSFLSAMLTAFIPIEQEHKNEQDFITGYRKSNIDIQREMWPKVYQFVKGHYNPEQVNIDGYVIQFKENKPQDVIDALAKDWTKACDERKNEKETLILEQNKTRWERHIREWGSTDYKRRKEIERIYYRYSELEEIVRILGREQPERKDELDEIVYNYMPVLLSSPSSSTEIEQIAIGDDLSHIMPIETALLSEEVTETIFYHKFAAKQLQIFANKPPVKSQDKRIQHHRTKPRLEQGPIIVSIDTSGSMSGKPEKLSKCLLIQLLRMAKKKKRKCFVITFSVRAQVLELTNPACWRKLKNFLDEGYSGGTDGEQMIVAALDALEKKDFCMADLLIISDFFFSLPFTTTRKRMEEAHNKGTRFYGLRINNSEKEYEQILDKMWDVKL